MTNQSCIFRVVQVIKSLQDPLEVGNNLPGMASPETCWGSSSGGTAALSTPLKCAHGVYDLADGRW